MESDKPGRVFYDITYTDGTVKAVRQSLSAEVAFEREFGVSVSSLVVERRAEWLYFIVWKSTPHAGDSFDAWLETVDSIDVRVAGAAPLDESPSPGD